jgi:cytidylate kinase
MFCCNIVLTMKKQETVRPNIAFAGLTAAGKTTHAKILATELGYEHVSATQTILDILKIKNESPDRVWFSSYDKIEKAREGDLVDIELEARITKMANAQDGLILDTWALAWVYDGPTPTVRLWIDSDETSRTHKCYVSQDKSKPLLDMQECRDLVNTKDNDTAKKFRRRLHFDLFNDREKYDIVLDNTMLMPEATKEAERQGIATFTPIVRAAVDYCIKKLKSPDFDTDAIIARELLANSNGMITRIKDTTL